ncbi:MAG: ATP-binding protein [Thermodesulfobacteriota bacterium]
MKCSRCRELAEIALPSHHAGFCRPCFLEYFSRQVDKAVRGRRMFGRQDRILVALSGGKDSLALLRELRHQGYDVSGLFVDLAIPGSSDAARAAVEGFCAGLGAPLLVADMAAEGLPIPLVKERVRRPICSVCGKIKRHYFNRAALEGGFTVLATGHNLDDEVGRLFANVLRWDAAYLSDTGPVLPAENGFARKVKPLCRLTEFETAAYCFFHDIPHHSAPCPYSGGASFTVRKQLMNGLEKESPGSKLAFYEGFLERARPAFAALEQERGAALAPCVECGCPTSAELCGVCRLRRQVRAE